VREHDERIQARGRELVELVAKQLPREFEVTGAADAWPAVGVGLLSRMTTTLISILDLQHKGRRETDPATLSRSMYEHSVHFAWLAAEPSAARLQEWRKQDLKQRLKADTDMRRHGVKMFTDERRAELKTEVAGLRGNALKLEQLAIAADTYWKGKIPTLIDAPALSTLSGLYASLYRNYSGMAHPSMIGLNRVTDDIDERRRRIHLENGYPGAGPYGMATVVFGRALLVAAEAIGWPSSDDVEGVFARHPDSTD
jgi:hypothetical protein